MARNSGTASGPDRKSLQSSRLGIGEPALQRLLLQGWVKAEWKMTERNRRARFYTLPSGFLAIVVGIDRLWVDCQWLMFREVWGCGPS
jgi:hypothetical protein